MADDKIKLNGEPISPEIPDTLSPEPVPTPTPRRNVFSRGMNSIKNRVSSRANITAQNTKDRVQDSHLGQAAKTIKDTIKAKGFKNKASTFAKGTGKNIASNKRIKAIMEKFKKFIDFIVKNKKALIIGSIVFAVFVLCMELIWFWTGVAKSVGSTPHYYCDVEADNEIKQSVLYQQYCGNARNNDSIAQAAVSLSTVDISIPPASERYNSGYLVRRVERDNSRQYLDGTFTMRGVIPFWTDNGVAVTPPSVAAAEGRGMEDLKSFLGQPGYTPETFISVVPQLQEAGNDFAFRFHCSCDWTVCVAVRWSGADDDFPHYLRTQYAYLNDPANSDKWTELEPGEDVLPGDIAIGVEGGSAHHIWMFVGTWSGGEWTDNSIVQEKYPGSTSVRYEGSWHDYYARVCGCGDPWTSGGSGQTVHIYRFIGTIDPNSIYINITDDGVY